MNTARRASTLELFEFADSVGDDSFSDSDNDRIVYSCNGTTVWQSGRSSFTTDKIINYKIDWWTMAASTAKDTYHSNYPRKLPIRLDEIIEVDYKYVIGRRHNELRETKITGLLSGEIGIRRVTVGTDREFTIKFCNERFRVVVDDQGQPRVFGDNGAEVRSLPVGWNDRVVDHCGYNILTQTPEGTYNIYRLNYEGNFEKLATDVHYE